jgi:hypothetical protein
MKVKHMLLLSKVDNFNGEILVAFARCANSGDEWILDSTASFHMCIIDSPHDIVGTKSIQIKMCDGITITSTDDSVSTKRFFSEDGVLKMLRGSLIVLKGELKSQNLHRLCGTSDATIFFFHYLILMLLIFVICILDIWVSKHYMNYAKEVFMNISLVKLQFCEHCMFGKHKRVSSNTYNHKSNGILDYIHSNL